MIRNYFKIAWRNIIKDKLFSFIKIGGLSISIVACMVITLFITDELSFDRHYSKEDRIYRIIKKSNYEGKDYLSMAMQAPFVKVLRTEFPSIKKAARVLPSELFGAGKRSFSIQGSDKIYLEEGFVFADHDIFEVLKIPVLQGDENTLLKNPKTIVISKAKADLYFPNGDAVGKVLILDKKKNKPFTITGVVDHSKNNSHFKYDFYMTTEKRNLYNGEDDNWGANNYETYVLLESKTNTLQLEKQLYSILENYVLPHYNSELTAEMEAYFKGISYQLQPIKNIYLYSSEVNEYPSAKRGDIKYIWVFAIIALFILLLASINFINLSTAKSANRAKEIGLKKTIGATKTSLITQFLMESILLSFLSFFLAIIMTVLLLPFFNDVINKSLTIPFLTWWFSPVLLLLGIIIGLLSGLYPAFYLAKFHPIQALRGMFYAKKNIFNIRSILVVFQFAISIILIIGTIVVYQQMQYVLHKKLGYDKNNVLVLEGTNGLNRKKVKVLKQELLKLPDVGHVSISDFLPIEGTKRDSSPFHLKGKKDRISAQRWTVDTDYIKTFGIQFTEGNNFTKKRNKGVFETIVNQTLVKKAGIINPIGKQIVYGNRTFTIVGVVKDFHFGNFHKEINPLYMVRGRSSSMISIKMNTKNTQHTLKAITNVWNTLTPNQTIKYNFLDQEFEFMHKDVKRMGVLFTSFSLLAILVACLGMLGLSIFMMEQRKKEVSIRITLGASFISIYRMLSFEFLKWVFTAIIIAIPTGWYLMNQWLENFAYRISIGWDIFIIASFSAIIISGLTISYQALSTAFINPLNNLRTE